MVNIVDGRLLKSPGSGPEDVVPSTPGWPAALDPPATSLPVSFHHATGHDDAALNLLRIRTGDKCPKCSSGSLKVERAMELGHTFFLVTRYSKPLEANVSLPASGQPSPMQMGCHGIGISRIVGAIAEHLADNTGLNWPVAIAPYSCVVIPGKDVDESDALQVYSQIQSVSGHADTPVDAALDDRQRPLPWKLTDADLIGFPVIVLLGREWRTARRVEVQCRRLGVRQAVEVADLSAVVGQLHASL
jgi:prolyl-tRNA synthetase